MSRLRFDGETVVVTGAGRGLGREHALAFAARGANVVVNDLGTSTTGEAEGDGVADAVVDEIRAAGGTAIANFDNVATESGASSIIQAAVQAFGRLDVLVNNAGFATYSHFDAITSDQLEQMLKVTVQGTFYVTQAAWPVFLTQGGGRIINTTSNAGFGGAPELSHYGAAKLAVAGLTKNLAIEGADLGIRVNAIAPVAVTRMNSAQFFGDRNPDRDNWKADLAAGTISIGPPDVISPTVIWLAHQSTDISGEIFSTTSGRVAKVGFVVGSGYFNPDHTPEDLRDNAEQIRSLETFVEMNSYRDELDLIPPLFR